MFTSSSLVQSPSPVKRPQDVDMVIFRENTEDILQVSNLKKVLMKLKIIDFLQNEMGAVQHSLPRNFRYL